MIFVWLRWFRWEHIFIILFFVVIAVARSKLKIFIS